MSTDLLQFLMAPFNGNARGDLFPKNNHLSEGGPMEIAPLNTSLVVEL